ncbi:MAG: hypothetical protein U0164_07135 [Gemmatimonadaceae bacterium]
MSRSSQRPRCSARALATVAPLLALSLLVPQARAGAQEASANTLVATTYVFRGVTLTNVPTVQPRVALGMPALGGTLNAIALGNVEFALPAGANAISESGGAAGVNEVDLVAQFAHGVGPALLTLGVTRYEFSGHNRVLTTAFNTTELFAGARLEKLWGSPSFTANWDVQAIHGLYLEAAASRSVTLGRLAPTLGLLAGYSAGQERRGVSDAYFLFEKRGLTHVDVSASQVVHVGRVDVAPALHLQLSPAGQNTRIVGALPRYADRGAKLWFGLDLGWSHSAREH